MAAPATQNTASLSTESTNQAFDITRGNRFIDGTFPLFAHVFQTAKIPILIIYPFLMIFFVQVIFVSVFPWSHYWDDKDTLPIVKWLKTVLFYVPHPGQPMGYLIVSIVIFVFNALSTFIIQFQVRYYSIKRKFIKFLLYPIRFYFDTILIATMAPAIVGAGETFLLIAHGSTDPMVIVAFILYFISVGYEAYSFVVVQEFASKSCWVNFSPILNFDPTIMKMTLVFMLATMILFFILLLFEKWAFLFAVALQFAGYLYCNVYLVLNFPFVDILTCGLGCGWFIGTHVGQIIAFVTTFKDIKLELTLILPLAFFVGSIPCFLIFFIVKRNKIVALMNDEKRTQEEANEYFDSLGLDQDEKKALLYLRLGFQNYSPNFYNWTLINYIIEKYDSELAISTCLQILNFFPKETRLQNKLQRLITKKRKLWPQTRFLLYQVDMIKTLRQFSVSTASKLKLIELKNMSRHCEMLTRGALELNNLKPDYFEKLASQCQTTRAIWKEALLGSPNNPKFCEEFTRYLAEAECDFPESLKMKRRQQVIEMGSNFSVDHSFRSMVEVFPKYLTESILDLNGGVLKRKSPDAVAGNGSQNNSTKSNSQGSNLSSLNDENLDAEVEEYLGKQTLTLAKTRLALHRTLEHKLPVGIKLIVPITVLICIYLVGTFAFGSAISSTSLNKMVKSMGQLDTISQTRFYLALANINIILAYVKASGKLGRYMTVIKTLQDQFPDVKGYIDVFDNLIYPVVNFTTESSHQYEKFVELMVDLALDGVNISNIASVLVAPELWSIPCSRGMHPLLPMFGMPVNIRGEGLYYRASLSTLVSGTLVNQREFTSTQNAALLMMSPGACEVSTNFKYIVLGSNYIFGNISEFQYSEGKKSKDFFFVICILVPIATFGVSFVPFIIIHVLSLKALKDIIEIIHSFDAKTRSDAKEMIMVQNNDLDQRISEMQGSSRISIVLISIIGFISILFCIFAFTGCQLVVQANQRIINLNSWNKFASLRLSLAAEALNIAITAIAKQDIATAYPFIRRELIPPLLWKLVNELVQADNDLIQGTNSSVPCEGYDSELDHLNFINDYLPSNTTDPQDYYQKVSIHQQIQIYKNYLAVIGQNFAANVSLDANVVANTFNLANNYLFGRLFAVTQRMIKLAENEYTNIMNMFLLMGVLCFVSDIIFIIVVSLYLGNRISTYNAALFVIKRFSPYALLNNKMFSKVFLKGGEEQRDDKMSTEGMIIRNARDSIFCTNVHGVVEIVNNSVSTLLGFTPEQLLGQNVSSFFSSSDMEKIASKMEQMKSGQSSAFYEDDYVVISDASKDIPVHVIIIGMKKDKDDDVASFVVILRDQTALVQQKKAAEEAKAKSEKLLYQILPRDIVVQLNRGEKDISFVVPSATIIFIDVNRFSEYAANLSPNDIMSNLSYYFACIDKLAATHNMITKIKLIGDIYMAAAGLFNTDAPPESHADQVVQFGLECVANLDEVNIKLDASLQIRIGINSGGPVIAGVLGTDKPAFDIIGDPINVAARLQSTDEVNHVHISQTTYDLIKGLNYDVKQRGETYLKGKGKQMTYYVTVPPTVFNATGSNVFHAQIVV